MKNRTLVVVGLLCLAGIVGAQVSTNYNLSWHVIGGGGGSASSSNYRINGTVGQQLIGVASSDHYQVSGGYWYENASVSPPQEEVFDTGEGSYPSIAGTHNGTITPFFDITVSKMYTYPCPGTGGYTESVKIWNSTGWNVTATWNDYTGDWHNITFNQPFILRENETYNYTIRTGSYPQIIHELGKDVTGGTINCSDFTDVNGNVYTEGIPAIRLE